MRHEHVAPWGRTLPLLLVLASGCALDRADAAESERIAEVLGLRAGMTVADVGAGDGEWSVELARRVGEAGHVFATEVDPELIEEIEDSLLGAFLGNYTVLEGTQDRTGLDPGCCDAILVRMVYHHFQKPASMREDLWEALRPGGLIAIVDIEPQTGWRELDGVPDRGGHGIPVEHLIEEMTGADFELVSRHDDWNDDGDRYCAVFRRPALSAADEP